MSYASEVLGDSPLLYVRFEEPSGATCANSGSLGGDATAAGGYTRDVASAESALGVAIDLNGSTGGVSYPDTASLDITGDVTFECWIRPDVMAASAPFLMSKGRDSGSVGGYGIRVYSNGQLTVVRSGIADVLSSATGVITANNWFHIVFTRSGNTWTLYVNGTSVATTTNSTAIQATDKAFLIGYLQSEFGTQGFFDGKIDEVAVYNSALSSTRVAAHYAARLGPSAPVASFSAAPTTGPAPLTVQFTDESTNTPTAWDWDFGDTGTSTDQHPEHEYTTPGSYDVELEVTNAGGSDDELKAGYITVTAPPPGIEGFSVAFDDPTLEPDPTWTRLA
jgi:PKD repeat protein